MLTVYPCRCIFRLPKYTILLFFCGPDSPWTLILCCFPAVPCPSSQVFSPRPAQKVIVVDCVHCVHVPPFISFKKQFFFPFPPLPIRRKTFPQLSIPTAPSSFPSYFSLFWSCQPAYLTFCRFGAGSTDWANEVFSPKQSSSTFLFLSPQLRFNSSAVSSKKVQRDLLLLPPLLGPTLFCFSFPCTRTHFLFFSFFSCPFPYVPFPQENRGRFPACHVGFLFFKVLFARVPLSLPFFEIDNLFHPP